MQLLSEASVDEQVRQVTTVNHKNHVRNHWAPPDPDSPPESLSIQNPKREQIKALIVRSMLSALYRVSLEKH